MNILFICDYLYPHLTGGMEIFNFHFIKRLTKYFDVAYCARNNAYIENSTFHKMHAARPMRLFTPIQIIFLLAKTRKNTTVIFSYSNASSIIWFTSAVFCILFNRKYIVVNHWGATPYWKYPFLLKFFFNNSIKNIAVSNDIKLKYKKKYEIHFDVMPPLVPFSESIKSKNEIFITYNLPSNAFVISFIGSLKPMKNPQDVMQALHLLGLEYIKANELHLVFAGDGVLRKELTNWTYENNLSEYIHFLGTIKNENISDLYKISRIYIISSDYEGTSISLLEAMFNRLPIIGSNVQGINDMIHHNITGILYPLNDVNRLSDNIRLLVSDLVLMKKLGENAYAFYETNFKYEDLIEKYKNILNINS